MATAAVNPQAPAPAPQPQAGAASSQANPLQEVLGRAVLQLRQIGAQNTIIQSEMQQASSIVIQALQKVSQAASGPAQAPAAPPQQ